MDHHDHSETDARILITGGAGFVAPYVIDALHAIFGPRLTLCVTALAFEVEAFPTRNLAAIDVTDAAGTAKVIAAFQPTHVIHLAGIAAPVKAGTDPNLAWHVNLDGTRNVARAILAHTPHAFLVFAGSGLIYGDSARAGKPLTELDLVQPNNDYAATKAAADLALGALAKHGLRVVRCRPFNHTGPGQSEDFVLPNFASQIARIEVGLQAPVIKVGNLDAKRDFLDVRDVADAYARCILKSQEIASGLALNIASGRPISIRTLLDQMLVNARVPVGVEIDPARWRPNDVPSFVGDATLARRLLDWSPKYDTSALAQSLLDAARRALTKT
jgi:GDP-4-dehydro-6-deoxy-D-mannose reductase